MENNEAVFSPFYRKMRETLDMVANDLNGGEYKGFVTHVVMPVVLGTLHRHEGATFEVYGRGFRDGSDCAKAEADEIARRTTGRGRGLVNELEREIIWLNEELRQTAATFRLYRGAWLRHLGGYIVHKHHEIDGFGLRHDEQLKEEYERGLADGLAAAKKIANDIVAGVTKP